MQDWSRFSFDMVKTREALEKALGDGKCPISGDRAWTIAPGYVELRPALAFPTVSAPITSSRVGIYSTSSEGGMGTIYSYLPPGSGWPPSAENTYLAVMATCSRCGYIALFNAVVLGLVPSGEQSVQGLGTSPENLRND